MTHPSLGLPPRDETAGFPEGARRLRAARERLAVRALEHAVAADPTFRDRYDELGLRRLLHDAGVFLDRIAASVSADEPALTGRWADMVAVLFRRRRVPMDDLILLAEGLRRATASVLGPAERQPADLAIDDAIRVFRDIRRIGGDARKRNRLLSAIYKGP
ncbi:MAG TPA: hypothetical protein VIV06_03500 [Candidatus Limnocylindrales bacterium]